MSDRLLGDTIYMFFTTRAFATGVPTTLGGSPVISAYENDSLTQIISGITLDVDFDTINGLNQLTIVTSTPSGFENGKEYSLVITTGSVSGVSVVGEVVGNFSLGMEAAYTLPTTAITESYAANGVAPTPHQALMAIHQMLMSFGIIGTAYSVKQLDGATEAFEVTHDSATAPTSASRS